MEFVCSLVVAPTLVFLLLTSPTAFGGSATWNLNPTNGDWDTATTGRQRPSLTDLATQPRSASPIQPTSTPLLTTISEVNGIVFNAGASAFTIYGR